jgi:excisionase family DNA binding protein
MGMTIVTSTPNCDAPSAPRVVATADPDQDIITKPVLAERLGLTERTIESLMRRGLIPFIKLTGKVVRFSWRNVEAALLARETKV